jgi:hypothetical protein
VRLALDPRRLDTVEGTGGKTDPHAAVNLGMRECSRTRGRSGHMAVSITAMPLSTSATAA